MVTADMAVYQPYGYCKGNRLEIEVITWVRECSHDRTGLWIQKWLTTDHHFADPDVPLVRQPSWRNIPNIDDTLFQQFLHHFPTPRQCSNRIFRLRGVAMMIEGTLIGRLALRAHVDIRQITLKGLLTSADPILNLRHEITDFFKDINSME